MSTDYTKHCSYNKNDILHTSYADTSYMDYSRLSGQAKFVCCCLPVRLSAYLVIHIYTAQHYSILLLCSCTLLAQLHRPKVHQARVLTTLG